MLSSTALLLSLGLVFVLLGCSAFFSSSETAIFSLPVEYIDSAARSGDRGAARLKELRDDPHRLLVTILVGNNVVNMAISSIITAVLVDAVSAGLAVTMATVVASSLVLVFGEIVPKSYGLGNAKRVAKTVARPVYFVERLLLPLVVVFDVATRRLADLFDADSGLADSYLEDR
jgi:Mg2+/Co2+ transporter CorB